MRIFFAVDVEPDNKLKVSRFIDGLKQFNADIKWVEKQNIHLTLRFIGEVSAAKFDILSAAARIAFREIEEGSVSFSGVGTFPNWHQPRVVWLGIDRGRDFLQKLFLKLENALAEVGFPKEEKHFNPHLTIGRVRSQRNLDKILPILKGGEDAPNFTNKVKCITIFKSELTPQGPIYTALEKIKLK